MYIFINFILRSIHHEFDGDDKNYDLSAVSKSFIIKSSIEDIQSPRFPITKIDDILNIKEVNKERSKSL